MLCALELYFDDEATRRVHSIWSALDDAGVPSLATVPEAEYEPNVSLAVFETADPHAVAQIVTGVCEAAIGLDLVLGPLGFFLTEEAVAFLGVVPTKKLLDLHAVVRAALSGVDAYWPYYEVDRLVPHCTLAVGTHDKGMVATVVEMHPLPIVAVVSQVGLVELPFGRPVATVARR